ncbi:prephenate dehydrogenase/arogenate dehydrogenase family protein [Rhodococcus sp. NPDC127528]|uniref:prephenate dehydrogenase/arogenate dehydrogenase family protein n=1 Tax=unclassified Rhodococcus (in: high G+C Gram-positive bacteria) TaxID=192944 RepID=UPI003624BD77
MTTHPLASTVVAGGRGAVGAMLADLLRTDGRRVVVADPRNEPGLDVTRPDHAVDAALREAETVVLAVPEPVAVAAVAVLRDRLRPGALLVETLSVKTRIAGRMRDLDTPSVGINPMFAPSLGMAGRPVLVVLHRDGPPVAGFLDLLRCGGATVVPVTAVEHDRLCAATQALTHASVLAAGLALGELDAGTEELHAAAPPPHTLLLALLARVTLGTPEVYWDVQAANPFAREARAALAAGLAHLSRVCESGTEAEFAALMTQARGPLGDLDGHYGDLCARLFESLPVDARTAGGGTP